MANEDNTNLIDEPTQMLNTGNDEPTQILDGTNSDNTVIVKQPKRADKPSSQIAPQPDGDYKDIQPRRSKKWIAWVAGIVVAGGLGAGAWYLFGGSSSAVQGDHGDDDQFENFKDIATDISNNLGSSSSYDYDYNYEYDSYPTVDSIEVAVESIPEYEMGSEYYEAEATPEGELSSYY